MGVRPRPQPPLAPRSRTTYQTENGIVWEGNPVADWMAHILAHITLINDDGVTRLRVEKGSKQVTLDVPAELFGDPNGLARFITGRAGGMFSPRAGMHKHLAPAILNSRPISPNARPTVSWAGR